MAEVLFLARDGVLEQNLAKILYSVESQLTVAADLVVGDIHRVVEAKKVGVAVQEVLEAVEVTPETESIVVEE
jgi:hypothetical protein